MDDEHFCELQPTREASRAVWSRQADCEAGQTDDQRLGELREMLATKRMFRLREHESRFDFSQFSAKTAGLLATDPQIAQFEQDLNRFGPKSAHLKRAFLLFTLATGGTFLASLLGYLVTSLSVLSLTIKPKTEASVKLTVRAPLPTVSNELDALQSRGSLLTLEVILGILTNLLAAGTLTCWLVSRMKRRLGARLLQRKAYVSERCRFHAVHSFGAPHLSVSIDYEYGEVSVDLELRGGFLKRPCR